MLRRKKSEPAIYRDGMAQTNGDPVEDIPDDITAAWTISTILPITPLAPSK